MFDAKLQKYLYAEYSRDFFTDILHNISNKYSNIKYITLLDPTGENIFSYGENNLIKIEYNKNFDNKIIFNENNNNLSLSLSFGEIIRNKIETCFLSKFSDEMNNFDSYFYVLRIVFDKSIINKQLLFIKTIFAAIALLSTLVCYLTINQFQQKQ